MSLEQNQILGGLKYVIFLFSYMWCLHAPIW